MKFCGRKMRMKTRYKLERCIQGVWHYWGTYSNVGALVEAAAELGRCGYKEGEVRVTEVE